MTKKLIFAVALQLSPNMPQYTLYSDAKTPKPIFTEHFIDDMSNLKVGDYLVWQRGFEQGGDMTKVWNITRITKKCVYIEYLISLTDTYKTIRLVWRDIDARENPTSLYKGYLKNDSYEYFFHQYVKKDDMNLERFMPNK